MPNYDFDFLENLKDLNRRAGEAKDILTAPVPEPDMYDPNYLPNQQMAGYGLPRMFQAWNALQPEPTKIKTPEMKLNTPYGERVMPETEMEMGMPTIGSVKFPKVGKAVGKAAPAGAEAGPMTKRFGQLTGNELPYNMSLTDRIRLAKERSGPIHQTQTFEQMANQAELDRWKGLPKDFFYDAQTKAYNRKMNDMLRSVEDNPELYKKLENVYKGEL